MCQPGQPGTVFAAPSAPGSVCQALAALQGALACLASADPVQLTLAEQAECLLGLQRAESVRLAAQSAVLAVFDEGCGFAVDGQGSARSWLRWQARVTGAAASAAVGWCRRLAAHPAVGEALAGGEISESWARQVCEWTDLLPPSARGDADIILLAAAAAGASLEDLAGLAEEMRSRTAVPDGEGDGPAERGLRLDVHFRGAGRLRGDLSPRCAAAVQAVLDALGKKRGREDLRTRSERDHDALEEACRRLIAAGMVPDAAGQSTRIQLHMNLTDLLARLGRPGAGPGGPGADGGAGGEGADRWETARRRLWPEFDDLTWPREGGYAGPGPMARPGDACDASIVPVVTGQVDHDLLARLAAALAGAAPAGPGPAVAGSGGTGNGPTIAGPGGTENGPTVTEPSVTGQGDSRQGGSGQGRGGADGPRPGDVLADQYARDLVVRGAVAVLSGPGGLASRLRTGTLTGPAGSISLPLDVGAATDTIPAHLRRAVWLRDGGHCGFPGCADRHCQVHHVIPVSAGGPTALTNLVLGCAFHHLIAIHEWGWHLTVNPDGTKTAISPDGGKVLHSHGPPQAA